MSSLLPWLCADSFLKWDLAMHQPFPPLISNSFSGRNFGHSWNLRAQSQQCQSGWWGTRGFLWHTPITGYGFGFPGVTCLKTRSKNDYRLHDSDRRSQIITQWPWNMDYLKLILSHTQRKLRLGLKNLFARFPRKVESKSFFYFQWKEGAPKSGSLCWNFSSSQKLLLIVTWVFHSGFFTGVWNCPLAMLLVYT